MTKSLKKKKKKKEQMIVILEGGPCNHSCEQEIIYIYILKCFVIGTGPLMSTQLTCDSFHRTLKTNYGSETVIPLYVTGCREKIYS